MGYKSTVHQTPMDDINVVESPKTIEKSAVDRRIKLTRDSSIDKVLRYYKLKPLDFLWLEITSQCNNRCIHCYNLSSMENLPSNGNRLSSEDYLRLIRQAAALGCRQTQFTGGEPTLNPGLPVFIEEAAACGFEWIEVFTNLVLLPQPVLDAMRRHEVRVTTSFFSHNPETHDGITGNPGSHRRTSENIRKVVEAGLNLRAGIITMPQNLKAVQPTTQYLVSLGLKLEMVRARPVRGIGRGENLKVERDSLTQELCGCCWRGSICVSPEGAVYPCIMSRHMLSGNVKKRGLDEIVNSPALRQHREEIYRQVWLPKEERYQKARVAGIMGAACSPAAACQPACVPRAIRMWM